MLYIVISELLKKHVSALNGTFSKVSASDDNYQKAVYE